MKDRITQFLSSEGISPAEFADKIGVQRSSVSHILSGRNNPSFEFIQKILSKYKFVNAEWLVMGTGNMVKTVRQGDLFEDMASEIKIPEQVTTNTSNIESTIDQKVSIPIEATDNQQNNSTIDFNKISLNSPKQVEKVIILYTDKTFAQYNPEKE